MSHLQQEKKMKFKKHDLVKFYSNYHQDYFIGEVIETNKESNYSFVSFTWVTQWIKNEHLIKVAQ